ncbi:fimbrial protein [Klebsiella sp. R445]
MKKLAISAAIISSLTLSSVAFADDGKINFVGSITDVACTVTNDVSNPLTVTLGNVSRTVFTGAGSTAAPTKFTIALTECPDTVTSATVKFDGVSHAVENTILALNDDPGVATGVGIQLADVNNNTIPLYTASQPYSLGGGSNNLDFMARYYATSDTVTAGPANSTSNFTIVYN